MDYQKYTGQNKLRIMIYRLFILQQITIYFIITIQYKSLTSKQTIFIGFIKNQWSINAPQDQLLHNPQNRMKNILCKGWKILT